MTVRDCPCSPCSDFVVFAAVLAALSLLQTLSCRSRILGPSGRQEGDLSGSSYGDSSRGGVGEFSGSSWLSLESGCIRLLHADADDYISADGDQVRKIDRRLRQCRNPLTDPTSDAYRKLAEERERKARENHILKVCGSPIWFQAPLTLPPRCL